MIMPKASPFRACHGPAGRGASAARRGLALTALFWAVVASLLAARVALFDEIAPGRFASLAATKLAALAALLP